MLSRQVVHAEYVLLPLPQQHLIIGCFGRGQLRWLFFSPHYFAQLRFGIVITCVIPESIIIHGYLIPRRMELGHGSDLPV